MITIFLTWYFLVPLVVAAFYWSGTRNFSHWRNRGVRHIPPTFFFGNIKKRILFQQSFHEFYRDLYFHFPGQHVAGFYEGSQPVLMIRDPNLIRLILVRDFDHFVDRPMLRFRNRSSINNMLTTLQGNHWKAVRALLTPTFTSGKIKSMSLLVETVGKHMSLYLAGIVNTESECDLEMKDFFGRFTMDVIASCAFGVQCDSLKSPNAMFASYASKFNDLPLLERIVIFAVLIICPSVGRFLPLSFLNRGVMTFLENVVKDTKQQRNQTGTRRNDFLQLMIDASQAEDKAGKPSVLSEDIIIAQSILFLLAGFETSSTVLSFTSYELALNQDVQNKLRTEIIGTLKKHKGECSYEAVQEMEYLDMVICESMRKHPPIGGLDRICTHEYEVPETSVKVHPGESISIPVMGLHYDPQYYPEPLQFDPERFSSEEKAKRSPYVFLPFGVGPRNCIGSRFAMVSVKIALAHLLCDYELQPCMKTEDPYTFSKFSMFLKAENGIWLNIKKITEKGSVN